MPGTPNLPYSALAPDPRLRGIENLEPRLHLSVSQDANGWTVVTPSADSLIVYVSSVHGSDSNSGTSPNSPVASLSKAASLVRSGYPDEVLLERGDTFNDSFTNWSKSGRSAQEPMLVGAYGTGARPIVASGTNHGGFVTNSAVGVSFLDIIGIQFYADHRDPNSPDFDMTAAGGGAGFEDSSPGTQILIENCSFSFYRNNIDIEATSNGPESYFTIRRTQSLYSWSTISHSQGLYADTIDHLTIDQCTFDHNGWNDQVPGATQAGYNHDIYYSYSCTNVTVENSVLANASFAGIMARAGGNIENNVFLNDSIALAYGNANGADSTPGGVSGQITGNVVLGDKALGSLAYGEGFDIGNTNGVLVANNIFTGDTQHAKDAIQLDMATGTYNASAAVGENNLTIENNIVNGWLRGINIDGRFVPGGTGLYAFNDVTIENNTFLNSTQHLFREDGAVDPDEEKLSGNTYYDSSLPASSLFLLQSNALTPAQWKAGYEPSAIMLASMPSYTDSTRTAAMYDATLGGSGSLTDFLSHSDALSQNNYQTQYTAAAVISYIQSGYGLSLGATVAAPPAATASPANVTAASAGAASYTFTVTLTDKYTIDTGSLDSNDVLVTGPNGFNELATFIGLTGPNIDSTGLQTVQAIYSFTPPGGSWTSADSGQYTITLRPGQITDMNGTAALGGTLGSFSVDVSPPTITLTSALELDNSFLDHSLYTFQVTFSDDNLLDVSTVPNQVFEVTGPNGYDFFAILTISSANANTQTINATYTIGAPSGVWETSDAGTYTITAHGQGIADTGGNFGAAGVVGTFDASFTTIIPLASSSVSGYVYNDANGNGTMDGREVPLVGVTVYADINQNGQLDPGEPSAVTDSNGQYTISSLAAGSYILRAEAPSGYVATMPSNGSATVNLASGQSASLVNFGEEYTPVVLNGGYSTPPGGIWGRVLGRYAF